MSIEFLGTTFAPASQWSGDEKNLIENISNQIDKKWPNCCNLLINTTWFGPQFDNGLYQAALAYKSVDQLFFLSSVDPVMMSMDVIQNLINKIVPTKIFYIGNFDGDYQFSFIATLLPKYFNQYENSELLLTNINHLYINYNRKPREHRINLINKLKTANLISQGVVSLGKQNNIYNGNAVYPGELTLNETPDDYAKKGNWGMSMEFGIPHDIHSLGNPEIWSTHFLTIVSETEFFPWDNLFVTEKTWKPILGLRPFLINGQTTIYSWLRSQGFRTFTHYFPDIELEQVNEFEIHNSIVAAINYLNSLSKQQLLDLYQLMLPDLLHNQQRFFEFAREQKYKIDNLFV
jgi:hypothetical protein